MSFKKLIPKNKKGQELFPVKNPSKQKKEKKKNHATVSSHAFTNNFKSALPASIEVAVVAVDARTAKRLSGSERPGARSANLWNDVNSFYTNLPQGIRQGARIYSTVIDLHGAPR